MGDRAVMMQCGHVASAVTPAGRPCCPICYGIRVGAVTPATEMPELAGRTARCSCGKIAPSDPDTLAFFEYRGRGSRAASDTCKHCGYSLTAHTQIATRTQINVVENGRCKGFEERGAWEHDSYYCGHAGWD